MPPIATPVWIRERVHLEGSPGATTFPTSDGQIMRFADVGSHLAEWEFALTRLRPTDTTDFYSDGFECRVHVADAEGMIWKATARFSVWHLLNELIRAQKRPDRYFAPFDAASPTITSAFDSPVVLEGVTLATDDRMDFEMQLGSEEYVVVLKYCSLVFDVAASRAGAERPQLYARLREGVNFEGMSAEGLDALRETRHPSWLPALVFEVGGPQSMALAPRAELDEFGSWEPMLQPEPFTFERTEERGEAQAGVRVMKAA